MRLPSGEVQPIKTSRYPRTGRRIDRVRDVLQLRQPTLTVVLEDVHDAHNVSAVLRSCDAVGVLDVHLVYIDETPPSPSLNRTISASANKWVRTHVHDDIGSCFQYLRSQDFQIWATHLSESTRDLYQLDLVVPTALVFGNEKRGVSSEAVDLADGAVSIPMHGMVESLNISVACAVSLFEAMRQRREAGLYDTSQLPRAEAKSIEEHWLRK